MTLPTEQFLKDVKDHVMEVIRDDGLYRHVRFRKPGTMLMHFDLLTWPGYLCYAGDMGTYVFTRLRDMFEFFRTDRPDPFSYIDRRYWSEKLVAVDGQRRHGSATEFSKDKFVQVIRRIRLEWIRERELDKEQRRKLWEAIDKEILDRLDDGEQTVYQHAHEFSFKPLPTPGCCAPAYWFQDLWDHDFHDYTFRFNWCCLALAWGIRQYDDAKVASATPITK